MNKLKEILSYEISEEENCGETVIIVAAGNASRMGGINKQLLMLSGMPVIARTISAFENNGRIKNIILVARKEDLFEMQCLCEKYNFEKVTDIIEGGKNRPESVKNGIAALGEDVKTVLIHDGARPLVEDFIIEGVIGALKDYKAVTCAVKVKDTVKRANEKGEVLDTLNRSELFAVQTPQGIWVKEYKEALEKAEDISLFTDDISVMEFGGHKAILVEGSYKNIKITTREDIALAKCYLEEEL